jgi:hypothetical protein
VRWPGAAVSSAEAASLAASPETGVPHLSQAEGGVAGVISPAVGAGEAQGRAAASAKQRVRQVLS